MSVRIEAVLALLPEIFPGVQPISLDHIRPYPDNPGPPVTEDQVQELTVPILEDGLVNPLKLRPDPANPLAPGLSPHMDNPRLKMDGTPWAVEDFNWMILSGERRWRAFRKLHEEGWVWRGSASVGHQASYRLARGPQAEGQVLAVPGQGAQPQTGPGRLARMEGVGKDFIPAFIFNPTEEEAVIITHTDNDVRDRGWFADYQSIEALIKVNPNLTQRQVAAKLKIEKKRVGWAISLLPLLNPQARASIGDNVPNSNKGIRGNSEIAASELAGLGPGTGLKPGVKAAGAEAQKLWPYPAIPSESQDMVWRALAAAIDQKMTQAKVKTLVQWILQGNKPEDYLAKGFAPVQPTEGRPAQPKTAAEKVSVAAKASTPSKTPEPNGASIRGAASPMEPAHPKQGPRLVVSAQGAGSPTGLAHANFGSWLATSTQGWWPKVKSFLLVEIKRILVHLIRRWIVTALVALVVILLLSPHLYVSLYHFATAYLGSRRVTTSVPLPAQTGGQGVAVPNQGLSTPNAQLLTANPDKAVPPNPVVSQNPEKQAKPPVVPTWASTEASFARDFATVLFDLSLNTWDSMQNYFWIHVDHDYLPSFVGQYYPHDLLTQMKNQNLVLTLHDAKAKFVRMEGKSGVFVVRGEQTRKMDGVAPTTRTGKAWWKR